MAHINHIRTLDHVSRMSLQDTIAYGNYSFAAFCGSDYQRNQVAINAISNFCGNMGVVLIHNNPLLESMLSDIYYMSPALANDSSFQMILANPVNEMGSIEAYYDPLYGLTDTEILDVIAPLQNDNHFISDIQNLRTIISDYLTIMEYQFRLNRTPFGDYPYNLDLLYELSRMPFSVLRDRVLDYLPANISYDISGRLSADGAQQKAYNAVSTFSQIMRSSLWSNRGFGNHTGISLISALTNRQLISIYIPESRNDVFDYIYAELQHLNKSHIPYLIVESGLDLSFNSKLKKLFLGEHSALPYCTGIVAEDTSSIVSTENTDTDLAALFSQTQEMYVFACSSVLSAQPFSDGIGNYFRQIAEYHNDIHRQPFHLLGTYSTGEVQREVSQRILNPEELVTLGTGCLLYGRNHPIPVLADHFII